jgi:hypothetical protein
MVLSFFSEIYDLDLLGDPITGKRIERGRPRHLAIARNRRQFNVLWSLGWNRKRIAKALGISEPTPRTYLFLSLRETGPAACAGRTRVGPRGAKEALAMVSSAPVPQRRQPARAPTGR